MNTIKHLASRLPHRWQQQLRQRRCRRSIRKGEFHAGEPEFDRLSEWIGPGDWVLDVGANIGQYTLEMSRIVGREGRVIAFEPIPETFSVLVGNMVFSRVDNVTALNLAVSDQVDVVTMRIPRFSSGLENFYQARIVKPKDSVVGHNCRVLTVRLDNFGLDKRVSLVKVDAEGHEASVLAGMQKLIERDMPVLILECPSETLNASLFDLGYRSEIMTGSPNRIYHR